MAAVEHVGDVVDLLGAWGGVAGGGPQVDVPELERFQRLTARRELKMIEPKREIAELKRAGPGRYGWVGVA